MPRGKVNPMRGLASGGGCGGAVACLGVGKAADPPQGQKGSAVSQSERSR